MRIYQFTIELLDSEYKDEQLLYWTVECDTPFRNRQAPPHEWVKTVIDLIYQTILSMGYLQIEYSKTERSAVMVPVGMLGELRIAFNGEVRTKQHVHLKLEHNDDEDDTAISAEITEE